uniref:Uncharacterized protein n=2 Tax=Thermorudis TaxID=1649508 RepID=A0A7C3A9S7_9BACT
MDGTHEDIVEALRSRGFRTAYETSAIAILTHPDRPGVEVRVGTVYVVIELDGREIYRVHHAQFDLAEALRRLADSSAAPTPDGS